MDPEPDPGQDLTIIILGNTGVGKSATGNTLLGRAAFESKTSFNPGKTHICEQTGEVFGKLISVIDTPGILGSEEQIATCCQEALKSSRPSLFLVVVKVDRFTEEQKSAVDAAVRAVGDQGFNKTYLLFTGGDTLKNKPVEDFISQDNESSLPGVVRRFSTRFHLFNNEDRGLEQVRELLEKSGHLQSCEQDHSIDARESTRSEVTRIILIGPAGGGKSSAGNRIVGSCEFDIDCDFDGVRKQHTCASADVEGGQITVVDSAGFTAEDLTPDRLIQEIRALIQLADPGPHLFVLVVKIGRLSRGDSQLLQFLTQLFDGEVSKFTMVLFTHRDALVDQSLHHKIQSSRQVSELVSVCGGRYCVLDNTQREDTQQVREVIYQIDERIRGNNGQYCSLDMFNMVEINLNGVWKRLKGPDQRGQRGQTLTDRFLNRVCGCFCPQSSAGPEETSPVQTV